MCACRACQGQLLCKVSLCIIVTEKLIVTEVDVRTERRTEISHLAISIIKALRVLMETMCCDFSSCRLSRVHFCR